MAEMTNMSFIHATDREIMAELGRRLGRLRESAGLTRVEAAARTGLARRTVHRAEAGENPTLATLLRLLRLYGRLEGLESFIPDSDISPMALLKKGPRSQRG